MNKLKRWLKNLFKPKWEIHTIWLSDGHCVTTTKKNCHIKIKKINDNLYKVTSVNILFGYSYIDYYYNVVKAELCLKEDKE